MEYINEKQLKQYPIPITYECSEIILDQMKKAICKIKLKDGGLGTGFFFIIPFPSKNQFKLVLLTNNHLINKTLLESENESLLIYIKDNEKYKTLNLKNRSYYTNEDYDITIIEIKEKYDEIYHYLELDDNIIENIFKDNANIYDNSNTSNNVYIKETIYIMQYPEGKLSVSYGTLEKIAKNKRYDFSHLCSTKEGSSGSPILNINNNKVFGIHKQASIKNNHNKGTFLDIPIKEYISQNNFDNKKLISQINEEKQLLKENIEIKDNEKIKEKIVSKVMSINECNDKYKMSETNKTTQLHLGGKKCGNEILDIIYSLNFRDLKKLYLCNNLIDNINKLEYFQCNKLELLWLNNNKIFNVAVFKNVKFNDLKFLNLEDNKISDISPLTEANFQNLEQLNLNKNNITDINPLENAKFLKIKNLHFFQNNISDIKVLERIKFENLYCLDLNSNNIDKNDYSSIINKMKTKIQFFRV